MILTLKTPDDARDVLEQALLYLAEQDGYKRVDLDTLANDLIADIYESGDRE